MTDPSESSARPGSPEGEFDAWYRAHWRRLAGALRLTSGDAMTAEEVAQEAFALAWARWPRVRRLDRPEGWLFVTAFRLLRRRMGREERRPRPEVGEVRGGDVRVVDALSLERALAALPSRQREAVVLRHVLGFDGAEAASMLGLRPDAFRQLLRRGMDQLRVSPELLEAT